MADVSDYVPPQPTFVSCAFCTCLVLVDRAGVAISPALGYEHRCGFHCASKEEPPDV